jgi:ATP-dependent helicase IRC3
VTQASTQLALRPYQRNQLLAIETAFAQQGINRVLVKSPTGTGKTVMFSQLPQHLETWLATFPEQHRKMLVIAHREELLDQAAAKISAANPGKIVMVEQGERRASVYADVIVASIQTLAAMSFRRLERFMARTTFRIVVVDEAHHAAADSYRAVLARLGFLPRKVGASSTENIDAPRYEDVAVMEQALAGWDREAPKDRLLIGVTATPNRSDAVGLGCVFQSLVYSYGLRDAIRDKWLTPITPWVIETDTSLDDVHLARGDFNQRELAEAVNNARRNQLAVAAWHDYGHGRATLAFTVDVEHAHKLADEFVTAGVRAAAVSGETPKDERRMLLEQFSNGQLDVLTNCMVLTEGTDLPRTSCILHAKPTKSATLYEQMTGRGLRLFPGKEDCVVIDLVDIARRHSLQAAPVLYGLPPGLIVKGKKLDDVVEEIDKILDAGFDVEAALQAGRLTLDQLKAKASTFNIWQIQDLGDFGKGRKLSWMKHGDDVYRVMYPWADGTEVLEVSKDLVGHWQVTTTLRPRTGASQTRTLAAQVVTSDDAARLAEAFVYQERGSVTRLRDKNAEWRSRPATEKQLAVLRKRKVPIPPRCTMGQASELIDLINLRRSL